MTTYNFINEKEYHLIQPYDGSGEPIHYDDEDEANIIEDEDEDEDDDEFIEKEEAYL